MSWIIRSSTQETSALRGLQGPSRTASSKTGVSGSVQQAHGLRTRPAPDMAHRPAPRRPCAARRVQLVGVLQGGGDRLFHIDRLAGPKRRQGDGGVGDRGRGDGQDVDLVQQRQQLVETAAAFGAVLAGQGLGAVDMRVGIDRPASS